MLMGLNKASLSLLSMVNFFVVLQKKDASLCSGVWALQFYINLNGIFMPVQTQCHSRWNKRAYPKYDAGSWNLITAYIVKFFMFMVY